MTTILAWVSIILGALAILVVYIIAMGVFAGGIVYYQTKNKPMPKFLKRWGLRYMSAKEEVK